jgi:hypothetical protein
VTISKFENNFSFFRSRKKQLFINNCPAIHYIFFAEKAKKDAVSIGAKPEI